jgi:uncharacterized membrane protein SpoIIM required for sporulation
VNIDGFISAHRQEWDRLWELTSRAGRDVRRLSPEEIDELAIRYQRVSTHLSIARTRLGDPALTTELSRTVARAAAVLYGTRPRTWRAVGRFVTDTFPAALWYSRAFIVWATLLFLVPAVIVAVWIGNSPTALEASAPDAAREAYVTEDFEAYYSSSPSAQFATEVTVNNIQVAILAFAGGGLAAIPTVVVMAFNGLNVGVAGGLFMAVGELPRFFGLILPHGLLELTAVFIAGGAGLRLGWTMVDPGDRTRGSALREEGRRMIAILIGLVAVFVVAGLIEGFVTGQPWPTWLRVGIGVVVEAVFLLYVFVYGRRAAAAGWTGAIGEQADAGWARSATAAPST